MKISKLITKLQNIKNKKGDIPVVYYESIVGEFFEPSLATENTKTIFDGEVDEEMFKHLKINRDFVLLNTDTD